MLKHFRACLSIGLISLATIAQDDFCFPSMHPPGGLDPDQVPQFIVLGWDDNAYSGEDSEIYYSGGTWDGGGVEYKTSAYPQGLPSQKVKDLGGTTPINGSTGYGIKWVEYLNSTYNIKGSFYFIAGQGETKDGYDGLTWTHPTTSETTPVVWGREHGTINESMKRLAQNGNELGNHTLDHMEINVTSNKGLPASYMKVGGEDYFGTTNGDEGWIEKAGRKMSQEAWKEVLIRAEESLTEIGLTERIGFRAPRLEINDNGLRALKELGYLYDCSYEEGSQPNFSAARSLWPYTSDNGSPANAYNGEWGKPGTNYPKGLWMMNTPHLEIPESIIDAVISNWKNSKMGQDDLEYVNSIQESRKVIAYDFNTLVMMGMTKDHFVEILKYNFDQRYNSNRSPLLLGLHCDYFSPMYDEETLLNDPLYDDVLKYNNHQDRKDAIEEFLAYVTEKTNVQVITMDSLVSWMKEKSAQEEIPTTKDELGIPKGSWSSVYESNATADVQVNNDILEIDWDLGKCVEPDWSDWPVAYVGAYDFKGLDNITHVEIEYEASHPFYFGIETQKINGTDTLSRPFKVLIGHAVSGEKRLSGPIPIRDFEPDFYDSDAWEKDWDKSYQGLEVNPSDVVGFSFDHGVKGCEEEAKTASLKIHRLIAYGNDFSTPITPDGLTTTKQKLKIGNVKNGILNLNLPTAGNYKVSLISLSGKIVKSSVVNTAKAGNFNLSLSGSKLSNAVYIARVKELSTNKVSTAQILLTK